MGGGNASAQGWVGETVQAGTDYYLYNVGAGYFLSSGNNWGTRATLDTPGLIFTPSASGAGFTLSTAKNGTVNTINLSGRTLGSNGYVDDKNNNVWTLNNVGTADAPVYTMTSGGNYLYYDGSNSATIADANADVNSNKSKWLFISKTQIDEHANKATMENPVDMTYLIKDANFIPNSSNNRPRIYTWPGSLGYNYDVAERYHAAFDAYQEIDVPNGKYDLEIQGFVRIGSSTDAANAYNAGTKPTAVLYANSESTPLLSICEDAVQTKLGIGSESEVEGIGFFPNNMEAAHAYFAAGKYSTNKVTVIVTTGKLKVGVKTTSGNEWVLIDNMKLTYYGVDLTALNNALAEKISAAQAISGKMNVDVSNELANAITAAQNVAQTEAALTEAVGNLETAINKANVSIAYYSGITDKYNKLDEAGKAKFDTTDSGTKYANNTLVDEDINGDYIVAIKVQTSDNADFTGLIVNPSFETGDMTGWTATDNGGAWTLMTRANAGDPKVGNYWYEKYGWAGKIDVQQTITGVPGGVYTVGVKTLDQAGILKLVAKSGDTTKETIINKDAATDFTVEIAVDDNSDLTIGLYCENHTANKWVGFDNFTLHHSDFGELTTVEGKMNAEVKSAQTAAIEIYNANKTVANYNAAADAIAAAQTSKTQYEAADAALTAQKALMDGTNVYNATGFATYNTAYEKTLAAYNDNTLAADVVNPTVATGWHTSTAYNFLLTPWTIGGEACNEFDKALYINTWSTEGNTDGSNFTTPFFEYWVADGEKLGNNTLTGTVTGLDNGLYSATAWVRVRATNGVEATAAEGVTLSVNGGTAVDATEGSQIGESQFTIAEVTAEGLVKDGNLKISFDVNDANISWLTFKNVMYTKVRDLTPEEQIVYATAEEIEAFKEAVEAAETKTVGFKAGNYSPYTNAEVIKALADAKAIDTENPVDVEIINAAIAAIADENWTVNAEEVNAINNGDLEGTYAAVSGSGVTSDRDIFLPTGWSFRKNGIDKNDIVVLNTSDKAGNNVTSIATLDNGGAHTLMYRGKWGTTTNLDFYQKITLPAGAYSLECDAWKSGLGGDGKIYVGASNVASLSGNETSWRKLSLTFVLDEEKTVEVGFNIKHNSDGSEKFIGFDNFVLKEIPAITRSTATEKYGTICAPFAATADGATVYSAAISGNYVTLTEVGTDLEAGVPYIYKATANAQTFSYASGNIVSEPVAAEPLVGVFEATPAPVGSYVMQTQNGDQQFYKVFDGAQPTVSANKAYLNAPSSGAKMISFGEDSDATAIKALDAITSGNAKIYDLNGRELKSLQKGVNIVNGVKVLVK